jgi:hypothetical protein
MGVGGGLVLTQHQPRDSETDGQRNTPNGSSGQPGALLEISYFTGKCSTQYFTTIILGLGKTTNSKDRFAGRYTNKYQINFLCGKIHKKNFFYLKDKNHVNYRREMEYHFSNLKQ